MKAHELARILLDGPNKMVTVRGYEGGVNEIVGVDIAKPIHLNIHSQSYYGEHEYHEQYCPNYSSDSSEDIHEPPKEVAIHIY